MKRSARFEIFRGTCRVRANRGKWEDRPSAFFYWRLRAANGRILAVGAEPFCSLKSAKRAVKTMRRTVEVAL